MDVLMPIVAGVLCGVLAGIPYIVGFLVAKKHRDASILPAMAAVCVSIVVIALSILIAWMTARSAMLVFAVALVVAFLGTVIVGAVMFNRKPRQ